MTPFIEHLLCIELCIKFEECGRKKINTVLDINELLASVDRGKKKGKSGFIIRSWVLCRPGFPHFGGDPRNSLPGGRKAETEDKEAGELWLGGPVPILTISETIWRNHIELEAIFLHRKVSLSSGEDFNKPHSGKAMTPMGGYFEEH